MGSVAYTAGRMSKFDAIFADALDTAARRGMRRRLRPLVPAGPGRVRLDGRELINFASNDYLGLSRHPALIARAGEWTERFGAGAGASRLVTGTLEAHAAVEARVAAAKGQEAALIFASGWQLNAGVIPALLAAGEGEALVFTDKLVHASLHHGCAAAGVRQVRFRHNDLDHLESLLETRGDEKARRFILTESVFSMDGDRADVEGLAALADRYGAFLYLDEAHATGVLGPGGMGLSGLAPGQVDLVMGTFSKALGGFGAYVAGSRALCDYLVNTCSAFIYTTAPPPAVLGAIDAALDLVPTMDAERAALAAASDRLRSILAELELSTAASTTQIVPAIVGHADAATALSAELEAAGFLAPAIRPPTVPTGTSRIRFALSAAHTPDDLDRLVEGLAALAPQRRPDA
ncbi:MAG TPA: 8-amino-7-oxononanoate synthase [Caulobacteraceae bacterium]|nr:8-amino-7-oxononanoate synthase [Caulobacteraceae bacterium]